MFVSLESHYEGGYPVITENVSGLLDERRWNALSSTRGFYSPPLIVFHEKYQSLDHGTVSSTVTEKNFVQESDSVACSIIRRFVRGFHSTLNE